MFPLATMSNSTSISEEASASSGTRINDPNHNSLSSLFTHISPQNQLLPSPPPSLAKAKKNRSQPGHPDPDAEVVALSPKTLMASNRFVCEICNKGFQRDQNLQLHRRGHNLPWKLKQKSSKEGVITRKRVYVCPEASCVHNHPSRALGDLTGIKKHYSRKHGEKKWKCEKCSKRYAVQSDWKAHVKACGSKEYRCDCGTLFSRKDSFITHRAFCDALAEESARLIHVTTTQPLFPPLLPTYDQMITTSRPNYSDLNPNYPNSNLNPNSPLSLMTLKPEVPLIHSFNPNYNYLVNYSHSATSNMITSSAQVSATALLQKASIIGPMSSLGCTSNPAALHHGITAATNFNLQEYSTWQRRDQLTRDFLGVATSGESLATQNDHLLLDLVTASNYLGQNPEQFNNANFPNLDDC